MSLTIRWASTKDQTWVDAQYAAIDFKPSDVEAHQVIIASWADQQVGLGRLVPVAENQFELGGIYVLPDFRQKGIAARIVQHLIEVCPSGTILYCIPFLHLTNYYQSFGFKPVTGDEISSLPKSIYEKWQWCNGYYDSGGDLLLMHL